MLPAAHKLNSEFRIPNFIQRIAESWNNNDWILVKGQ